MFKESDIVLNAKHIVKQFPASHGRTLTACNDINLNVYKGKTLGIVGESGCGKSTFVRMVISLDKPTSGEILYHGKNLADLSKKETWLNRQNMQMVFQDPLASFDPKMKIVDILTEPLINFGKLKKSEKEAKARELLEMVELPGDFVDRYPHNMSGGQRQRVGIARAIALEPEIIFCDESTSALDVSIQKAILELLVKLQKEKNIAIGFICHDLAMISSIAHQIAVMYMGNIVEILPGEEVARGALHPYTKALLQSVFDLHMDFNKPITPLEGEASMPTGELQGCPFQNRCASCMEKCQKENEYDQIVLIAKQLQEMFPKICGVDKYQYDINGGDYTIDGRQKWRIAFVLKKESVEEKNIINYNFHRIEVSLDENNNVYSITIHNENLNNKIGDYPIITVEEAKNRLLEQRYWTSATYPPNQDNISKIELIYKTSNYHKYFAPYYCF